MFGLDPGAITVNVTGGPAPLTRLVAGGATSEPPTSYADSVTELVSAGTVFPTVT
jgi:hypothetical protein